MSPRKFRVLIRVCTNGAEVVGGGGGCAYIDRGMGA